MERKARKVYLRMKTLKEAQDIWTDRFKATRTGIEEIEVTEALNRVTASPVFARRSVPHYHGAAMDGYAVDAALTFGASDVKPLRLKVGSEAFPVDTGDPLPDGTNAVIMIEHVFPIKEDEIEIRSPAYPWQHVRKVGEDIVAGELILPERHLLKPADLACLLAAGIKTVKVYRKPLVWIQPTGSELVPPSKADLLKPGDIIEFNGTMIKAMVEECNALGILQEIVPDEKDAISEAVKKALKSEVDLLIINAGSSAGSEDYTAQIVDELGRVLVHGVTMMPGKPVVLGEIDGKPVVGLPGYPVSALLAFDQFVRPLLWQLQGIWPPAKKYVDAVVGRKIASKLGLDEFVRVIVGRVADRLVAMPIQRGAGVITSLTRADGIVVVSQEKEGFRDGETVKVELLRPEYSVDWNLLMIGSHDNTIDVLASELKRADSRIRLVSSNVGSLGGLMALRRGLAHLAGSHLLNTADGSYNFSYVEQYLKGIPVRLIELAKRQQGFIVQKGNPKNIRDVKDLARGDVTFINRQGGAGTRILLDYELEKAGIQPESIKGYDQEEYTHMAVAVAVVSGRADAGMGIFAAARALELDFVPVTEERYDLIIREDMWEDRKIRTLLDIVSSDRFRGIVRDLGGYDPSNSGTVRGIWNGTEWVERRD
ncbi:molybdopterin biosynthesis protein [Thermodesulforhabdus norvegica]|uniref:Molybdopterin molybdenumtransferase n=1 Tax=Thermodesulforhabdus norvegica TaxID=39841 RepID=A0A1I4S636_9BACT|nr:molybdopterin biosynthesis protein [Thermodesulforhabdus norvegica]SFM59730.1 molybdopterin molybdochelatase [Thermodesulforhabdus norvegica]